MDNYYSNEKDDMGIIKCIDEEILEEVLSKTKKFIDIKLI